MSIVQCPRCRDEVTVPVKASPQALVRCPLCLEEYLLREALADRPPTLLVIDGSAGEEEPALVGAAAAAEGGDYRLAGGGSGSWMDSSAPAGATVAPARQVKAAPRPKRKEKSAIAEGLKIVVGGLIGISLAPLILWWVFGNDTFELGPVVSPYAPWIVPQKFRGTAAPASTETVAAPVTSGTPGNAAAANNGAATGPVAANQPGENQNANQQRQRGNGAKNGKRNTGRNASGPGAATPAEPGSTPELTLDPLAQPSEPLSLENLPFEATLPTAPAPTPTATPGETAVEKPAPIELDPLAFTNPKPEPTEVTPAPEPTSTARPEPAEQPKAEPAETPKPTPAATPAAAPAASASPTPQQFFDAAVSATEALDKVNAANAGASVEERQQKFTAMFQAGSRLGQIAAQLDIQDPASEPSLSAMRSFLAGIASTKGKISAVKYLASKHYAERKHGDGMLLAGTVTKVTPRGPAFELTVDAGKGLESLAVVSNTDPEGFIAAGDEIVLVGRIVDEPKNHLPGYDGEAPRVVLSAYAEPAPKTP